LAKLNFGVIGCGIQGTVLARALTGVEAGTIVTRYSALENAKITAVADINKEAARKFMKEFGVSTYFIRYEDLLDVKDIDAVMIALPHSDLARAAIEALGAGKHVLLEKPMAISRTEARQIVNVAKNSKQKLMVGYSLRYSPSRLAMKNLLSRGAVGEADVVIAGKGGGPLWGWLLDPGKGGGIMRYLGVHVIDQILWMLGGEVIEAYGQVNFDPTHKCDETNIFTLRFKSGLLASVCVAMPVNVPFDFVEVAGSEGTVRADWIWCGDATMTVQSKNIHEYESSAKIVFQDDPLTPMYRNEVADFVDCIVHDKPSPVTAEEGLKVLEIVDAVFESNRTGKPVQFPLT